MNATIRVYYMERVNNFTRLYGTGVTGQNIPPAGVYPGILWSRPIYTPGYILA